MPAQPPGDAVLDLCTARNPEPPPERFAEAVRRAGSEADPLGFQARARIAERCGLQPNDVRLGDHAAELAERCASALLGAGSVVFSIEPSPAELARAARKAGARVVRWRSVERTGHRVDLEQVAALMQLERPNVVSLYAPGDPTGASVPLAQLAELANAFAETVFVVDQRWLAVSDDHADLARMPTANVVYVRTLASEFGVGGAYALSRGALSQRLGPLCTADAAAQAALVAALGEQDFVAVCRSRLQGDRARLAGLLDQLGLAHTPSVAPFLLVRVARAEEVSLELSAQHGVAVCDATPFGLPDHLRIAAVSEAAAPQLMAALMRVLERRGLVNGRER
jgi:histidinol-phosphate aminotransferase